MLNTGRKTKSLLYDVYVCIPKTNTESNSLNIVFLNFLSYYCCMGGTLWHIQKCLQCILVKFIPSIILLYTLSPFLAYFQQVSFFHFDAWIYNISTIISSYMHPFLICSPSCWYQPPHSINNFSSPDNRVSLIKALHWVEGVMKQCHSAVDGLLGTQPLYTASDTFQGYLRHH
jgi:hypothetical protein